LPIFIKRKDLCCLWYNKKLLLLYIEAGKTTCDVVFFLDFFYNSLTIDREVNALLGVSQYGEKAHITGKSTA
jgi:hypothetical protein